MGVYIDAGSRYENEHLRGVSHIMDRLAFKSTSSRSNDGMLEALEGLGGHIQCASSRESLMYQAASFNSAVPKTMALLAETIRDPLITEEEVQQQLETASYEISEIWTKPELILPELVHMAAYKDNTLGNPLLCPEERLGKITRESIQAYRSTFFRPERMVLAFAGVKHNEAVRLAEQYFGDMTSAPSISRTGSETSIDSMSAASTASSNSYTPASPLSSPVRSESMLSKLPFLKNLSTTATQSASHAAPGSMIPTAAELTQPARYTGGFLSLPPLPPPVSPVHPALSHVHLAFEALPISSPDIYALAALQTLLGGGGSFSAGGPGKGMYSRLYTNVLNQHGWVESCVAFNHSYTDSGLFGISASCAPSKTGEMIDVMSKQLHSLTLTSGWARLGDEEVRRAKNQLRSQLLMNLESRMVELEDLGRQVQVHGRKVSVREMCKSIDALTIADLRRVASQILIGSSAPTVVLQEGLERGITRKETSWSEIQDRIEGWGLGTR